MAMRKSEHKLTFMQTLIMISSTLIGAGVLTLPLSRRNRQSERMAYDPAAGRYFYYHRSAFFAFSSKNSGKTLYKLNSIVAGKFIGLLLNLYICLYFIGIVGYQARILGEVVGFFLLKNTPMAVVVFIFCSRHLSCGRRRLFNCKGIRLYFPHYPYYFYDASDVQLSLVPARFYPAGF
ncbi:GerAB/ArcD/ProY family transporter [Bacillus stercoris]|nr:GerAB/ArcD/ProY family transporter [Bacillus stercoris]